MTTPGWPTQPLPAPWEPPEGDTVTITLSQSEVTYAVLCVYVAGLSGLMPQDIAWNLVSKMLDSRNVKGVVREFPREPQ